MRTVEAKVPSFTFGNNTLISWWTVINEDIYIELLELLELHCELVIARFGLLDQQ